MKPNELLSLIDAALAAMIVDLQETLRDSLRSAVRALWTGNWTYNEFLVGMADAITHYFTVAWYEGAKECGVDKEDLSDDELAALEKEIVNVLEYAPGYGEDILDNSKENGGLLGPLMDRVEVWAARYDAVKIVAKSMACADKKFQWNLGPTENHCSSCSKLDGKVKRMSYWADNGILPRQAGVDYLECGGYRCQCTLDETDAPLTRGKLPSLP